MAENSNTKRTWTTTSGTRPNALAADLAKPESKQRLEELDALSRDPQYSRGVAPDVRQSLQDAVAQAKQAYDARVNQNDWLEVAQTLGRAVAQFGAAQSGIQSGNRRDMSNLNMGPGIDYGARSDRSFREYQASVGNAKDLAALDKQSFLDNAADKKEQYQRREDYLSNALKVAREHESDDEKFRRQVGLEKWKVTQEEGRDARREDSAGRRDSDSQRKLELQELNKQEKSLQKILQARQLAGNNTELVDDLGKKSADKLQQSYGKILSEGDLNLQEIQATKPGMLWGTNPDTKKTRENINAKILETKNLLDGIARRKKELISGAGQQSQVPVESTQEVQQSAPSPTPVSDKVQVRSPQGVVGTVPRAQLEEALKQGFTEIK